MAESSVGLRTPARMAIFAAVIVGIAGFFLASTLLSNVSSNSALVISSSVTGSGGSIHVPGIPGPNASGVFTSCLDTDGGKDPSTPGAVIIFHTSHPIVGADARKVIANLATVTQNILLPLGAGTDADGFDIDYIDNHAHYRGQMYVFYDHAASAETFTNDQPVTSEPGVADTPIVVNPQAVLSEQYCTYFNSYSTPTYLEASHLEALYTGKEYDSDFIEYPRGFYDFVINSHRTMNTSGYIYPTNYLKSDADYLLR